MADRAADGVVADRVFDTGTDDIGVEVTDGVMTITLNRPERRNALSTPMLDGLVAALADAEVASDVGAVVLTGAGGAFCAGGDVKGMAAAGGEGGGSPLQTTLEFIASAVTSAIPPGSCMRCPSRPSQQFPELQRAQACRWPWRVTCGMRHPTRS